MTHTQIPALRPHMSAWQEECENVVDNDKVEEQAAHSPASSLEGKNIFKLESSCWMLKMFLKMDSNLKTGWPWENGHEKHCNFLVGKNIFNGMAMSHCFPLEKPISQSFLESFRWKPWHLWHPSYGGPAIAMARPSNWCQFLWMADWRWWRSECCRLGCVEFWVCGTGFPPILWRILRKWQRILTRLGAFLYHSETGSWYFANFWSVVWTMGDDDHYFHKQMAEVNLFFPMHQRH